MSQSATISITILVIYGIIILGGLIFLYYGINNLADELINRKFRNAFKKDLYNAIINDNTPSWDQVKIIAETNSLPRKEVSRVVKLIITEILSGESSLEKDKIKIFESYLKKHNQEEPFEGIPSEIRIHLERLKESSGIQIEQLEPLTKHITELLKINTKENKRQKYFSLISLFVGIGGLAIGLYQILIK